MPTGGGEDALAGFSGIGQRLCLGLALWNDRDPILKERPFGLTGPQGNHGQDVREYWWYLDATPTHSWNRWRYPYAQCAHPCQDLIEQTAARGRLQPEYELRDTGAFDSSCYWITEVHYAQAAPDDLLMQISVTNAGPEEVTLHVLPTAWFRTPGPGTTACHAPFWPPRRTARSRPGTRSWARWNSPPGRVPGRPRDLLFRAEADEFYAALLRKAHPVFLRRRFLAGRSGRTALAHSAGAPMSSA